MLMRGGVGAGPKPMADYIARDPRTGKPIEVATVVQRAQVEEGRRGAWSRLTPTQVLDLATGRSDVLNVMLDGERRSFTRLDGVEVWSSPKASMRTPLTRRSSRPAWTTMRTSAALR